MRARRRRQAGRAGRARGLLARARSRARGAARAAHRRQGRAARRLSPDEGGRGRDRPRIEEPFRRRRRRGRANDERVCDLEDVRRRDAGPRRMLVDLLRARRLVDAEGAEAAVGLVHDVGAKPADVGRHLLVTDLLGTGRCCLQLLRGAPATGPADHVGVHGTPSGPEPGSAWM